jgi:ankyrin
VTRIVTSELPQYLSVVSRLRQEVHVIGPEGGVVSSTAVPQVQAIFPPNALTKKIRVGLQVNSYYSTVIIRLMA